MTLNNIRSLQKQAYEIAESKGFHEGRNKATRLALIHSEVSEALEADRNRDNILYAEELADIVIRVLDTAEIDNVDLQHQILRKMEINKGRKEKHGKRY